MARVSLIALIGCYAGNAAAQSHHWSETPSETVWRDAYTNCDKGYSVDLPAGVIGHASLPPNPNHGFLISAADPGTTASVNVETQRIVGVYDQYDALELGSARAYLNWEIEAHPNWVVLETRKVRFGGLVAVSARYRVNAAGPPEVGKEIVLYRKGVIYVILLRSTSQDQAADSALFDKIKAGFRLLPFPRGECSNP